MVFFKNNLIEFIITSGEKECIFIKIYFAGKISANGWRQEIVDLRGKINGYKNIRSKYKGKGIDIGDGYIYNGPYMIGCDHRAFHGDNTHGLGVGRGFVACCPDLTPFKRNETFNFCIDLIQDSDAIFCYIDEADAYGTVFELGYAYANRIPVFIYFSEDLEDDTREDYWFATTKATRVKTVKDAREAFLDFKQVFKRLKKSGSVKEFEHEHVEPLTEKQLRYLLRILNRLNSYLKFLTSPSGEAIFFSPSETPYSIGHFSKKLASNCITLLKELDDNIVQGKVGYYCSRSEWIKGLNEEQRELFFGKEIRDNIKHIQRSVPELEKYNIDAIFEEIHPITKEKKKKREKKAKEAPKLDSRVKRRNYSSTKEKAFDYISDSSNFKRNIGEFITYQIVKPGGELANTETLNGYDRKRLAYRFLESGYFDKNLLDEVLNEYEFEQDIAQYIDNLIPKAYAKHLLSLKESPSSYEVEAKGFGLIYQY